VGELVLPRFLDVEASSLSANSYPIEVAWSDREGDITSYLINPYLVDGWIDWSLESQKIHGITREQCKDQGVEPRWLCKCMSNSIDLKENIYADGGEFDEFWIDTLYGAGSDLGFAQFKVMHSDRIMLALLSKSETNVNRRFDLFKELKEEARQVVDGRHRATVDVQYLIELYKLCHSFSMTI